MAVHVSLTSLFKASQFEEVEPENPIENQVTDENIGKRFSRRKFLQASCAVSVTVASIGPMDLFSAEKVNAASDSPLNVDAGVEAAHLVAEVYGADILLYGRGRLFPETRRNSTLYIRQQRLRQSNFTVKMITWDTFRLRHSQRMDRWC